MKKLLLTILLTFSSLSFGADEHKYEAVINPNEAGVYLIDQINGKVKFCQLTPNPLQQELLEMMNQ